MAPSRKSRGVNKRFSYINEASTSSKNVENASKNRQRKRKLTDMIGSQWTKDELERFYKAYRKYGQEWEKIAAAVQTRSPEMIEALYTMNKAYLSLPKGYASAAGLIAMMTDHYSNMGDSDSEQEINEGTGASRKPLKRARGTKGLDASPVRDLLRSQPTTSSHGCLSLLKKKRSGSRPWAVGKRTPRVPVSYSYDEDIGNKYISPVRQGVKIKVDAVGYDVAHEIALALTEASQRGGSPQVSRTPNRKVERLSPMQNYERLCAEMTSAKLRGSELDEGGCELSLGSTEAEVGDHARDKRKGKRYHGRKPEVEETMNNHLDDIKEACSGTEEGQKLGAIKGKFEMEVADTKFSRSSSKGPRKKSKKALFGEGEDAAFDALQTLADLSLRLPETIDTESSVHVDEEKTGIVVKSKLKGNNSSHRIKATPSKTTKQGKVTPNYVSGIPDGEEESPQMKLGTRKRRQKSLPSKILDNEEHSDSHPGESQKVEASDDVDNFASESKCSQDVAYTKQAKLMKPLERISSPTVQGWNLEESAPSTVHNLSANQLNLPTKVRSRRKINAPKPLIEKDVQPSENLTTNQSSIAFPSYDRALILKEKLSNCLSRNQVRRWCVFEWFYSAIDYPWFSKREFVEYLDHVGLGHIPRLTHVEWGVIRSSLGKPRRFSEQFLKEEKEKLNQYRESVRKHYTELRAGTMDGLPFDLARPLSVGQRIIALHPRTREVHDGSVLTVDHSRCRVQFDKPELGVEFIMDVDCMPLNPLENMPVFLTRPSFSFNKFGDTLNELQMNEKPTERKMEGYIKFSPCKNLENTNGPSHTSPSAYRLGKVLQQSKGVSTTTALVNNALGESVNAQHATNAQHMMNAQPSILSHIQTKEADIQALTELSGALDRKEVVVSELKRMNDEAWESQKDGGNCLKDSESFKKHYAAVLLLLSEVNEQVSCALFGLRQRNTYQGTAPPLWLKPNASVGESVGHCYSSDHSIDDTQESGSHVAEIVESSKTKAQTMVNAAIQAISSLKKEGSSIDNIEEAIDFVNDQLSINDLNTPAIRSSIPVVSVQGTLASEDQTSSSATNVEVTDPALDTKLNLPNEAQIPSDLITQCVATLLMIQRCTERQFPPSDVAQVLDSVVTSLKPRCSQNLPIYAEIQKCMGIIRSQILALIPT